LAFHSSHGLIILIVLTSLSVGCSSAPPSPSPEQSPGIAVDQLSGTWNLVALQPNREPEQAPPAGAVYTLTFGNAEYSTRADCASCRGTFMLTGATLATGPIVLCTSVNCQETDFQSRYRMLLSGSSTVMVEDNGLALSSPRGVLRLRR